MRRIHQFRNGKDILKLLQRELDRVCKLEKPRHVEYGTPEWDARQAELSRQEQVKRDAREARAAWYKE